MKVVLLLIIGFLGACVLAEGALQLLPVSTGYRFGAVTEASPILHGEPRFPYVYSRGWNLRLQTKGTLNNEGFRADYDYVPRRDSIVVIGNSFIQADTLPPRDTLAQQLQTLVHEPVYGVGVDGFSLADYLAVMRWSGPRFGSHTFVLLLTTGDLKRSCQPGVGQHHFAYQDGGLDLALTPRPEQSALRGVLGHSALYRYLFDNLQARANWDKGWRRAGDAEPVATGMVSGCATLKFLQDASAYLISNFQALAREHDARIVLLIAPGYRRDQGFRAGDERDIDFFADQATAAGLHVVELEEPFMKALRQGTRLDFMPLDGHWTAAANALAARATADSLRAAP